MNRDEGKYVIRTKKPQLKSAIKSYNDLVKCGKKLQQNGIGFGYEYDEICRKIVVQDKLVKDLELEVREAEERLAR